MVLCVKIFRKRSNKLSLREKYQINDFIFNLSPKVIKNKYFVVFPHKVRKIKLNWTRKNLLIISRFVLMYIKYFRYIFLESILSKLK